MAGHNVFPHNHNDIGTFAYYRNGVAYRSRRADLHCQTFGPKRYEIIQCWSLGHSVPYINNTEQSPGKDYAGAIEPPVEADGCKRVQLDLTGAYSLYPGQPAIPDGTGLCGPATRGKAVGWFTW
jgi:hypothetical protein